MVWSLPKAPECLDAIYWGEQFKAAEKARKALGKPDLSNQQWLLANVKACLFMYESWLVGEGPKNQSTKNHLEKYEAARATYLDSIAPEEKLAFVQYEINLIRMQQKQINEDDSPLGIALVLLLGNRMQQRANLDKRPPEEGKGKEKDSSQALPSAAKASAPRTSIQTPPPPPPATPPRERSKPIADTPRTTPPVPKEPSAGGSPAKRNVNVVKRSQDKDELD